MRFRVYEIEWYRVSFKPPRLYTMIEMGAFLYDLRSKSHRLCVVLAHKQGIDFETKTNTNKKAIYKIAIYECLFGFRECITRRNP